MSLTWKYLKRKLDDSSTVRGAVEAFDIPQKKKPPYTSFFLEGSEPELHKDASLVQKKEAWTFIISDVAFQDAITNADNIVTLLNHTSGTTEGVVVKMIHWVNREISIVEEDEHGDKVFQVLDTYEMRVNV